MARQVFVIFNLLIVLCSTTLGRKFDEKCREYSQITKDKIQVSHNGPPNEFGKVPTVAGEFPHMAVLSYNPKGNNTGLCGGTLISDQYVLTTALCTTDGYSGPVTAVRLGVHNRSTTEDDGNIQEYKVAELIVHPEFKRPSLYNDIALLKLKNPVTFTKSVRPACLYALDSLDNGSQILFAGWGQLDSRETNSDVLMKVYLDLFTNDECAAVYKHPLKRKLANGIVDKLLLCAGGKITAKHICGSDIGSPLQILNVNKNVYEVAGLASFGKSCGAVGVPRVYTRVSAYIPWIESIVWP